MPVWSQPTDPVDVAATGVEEARRLGRDVLVVDTAGRLHVDEDLMDEALLRRVRFKVLVGGPDEDQYKQIWRDLCHRHDIEYRARVVDSLVERQYRRTGAPFRGVHPRDLLSHIASAARYRGRPVELTPELMQAACRAYFVRRPEEW